MIKSSSSILKKKPLTYKFSYLKGTIGVDPIFYVYDTKIPMLNLDDLNNVFLSDIIIEWDTVYKYEVD